MTAKMFVSHGSHSQLQDGSSKRKVIMQNYPIIKYPKRSQRANMARVSIFDFKLN